MPTQISPGVSVSEFDTTAVVPAFSTTSGAIAGVFNWGPVDRLVRVSNEDNLLQRYGAPSNANYENWFVAANFLSYGNNLNVSRAAVTQGFSNTLAATLTGNNELTIEATDSDIEVGHQLYGSDIEDKTIVTGVTINGSNTVIEVSKNIVTETSILNSTKSVNFYDPSLSFSAVANSTPALDRQSYNINNRDSFEDSNIPTGVEFVAKYPGSLGNSLKVSVCSSPDQYESVVDPFNIEGFTNNSVIPSLGGLSIEVNSRTANVYIANSATLDFSTTYNAAERLVDSFTVGDYVEVGNNSIGRQLLRIKDITSLSNTNPLSPSGEVYFNLEFDSPYNRSTNFVSNTISRKWEYFNNVSSAPGSSQAALNGGSDTIDEVSVVITDEGGEFTGNPGAILETFENLSRISGARSSDGTIIEVKSNINSQSNYIWMTNDLDNAPTGNLQTIENSTSRVPYTKRFVGGSSGSSEFDVPVSALAKSIDLFNDSSAIDISLFMAGRAHGVDGTQVANYITDNVSEIRKDCIVFVSPRREDVVGSASNAEKADNCVKFRRNLRNSSYVFIDSGYKYQYDKYNDVYRYIPLNGDIAGLAARTDNTRDAWWSFAGFNRGQIKNVIKLAWSPDKNSRDTLYKADINPVVRFEGQGTVLFGDKTALGRASSFDRINVRRLFIVLSKTISRAADSFLFEFNDEFTRSQFKNLVEPYLRDVQGRRGIEDFRVVCDETNNTPQVIDSNRFVGDIYIRAPKSTNFIQLNFVSVGRNVSFNEIVGQF